MGGVSYPLRFEVYLVDLEPTRGSEIKKVRPCAVISPNEMNMHLSTLLVAPMTTGGRDYPSRIPVQFEKKEGRIALDQLRTIDRQRLLKKLGSLQTEEASLVLAALREMFHE